MHCNLSPNMFQPYTNKSLDDRSYKNIISEKNRLDRLLVFMPQYKEINMNHTKLLEKTIFIAKSNYYSNTINLSNGDSKSTWKTSNHVIKPKRKFPTIKLEAGKTVLTDPT